MAYWWVSHNQNFEEEREKGYISAPKSGRNGRIFHYWSNITDVRAGDLIFSYARQSIGAIGVAASAAYDAPQPKAFEGAYQNGRRVDVVYRSIEPALRRAAIVDDLIPLLPERNSPFTKNKRGVQGYLFSIPPKAGRLICERLSVLAPVEERVADALARTIPDETTKEALVQARLGHGQWRQNLLKRWSGKCVVTGLTVEALLRASHIKPWRDSDNRERLDVYNGFILGPAYDAAFDAGLISFEDGGAIVISPRLPANQLLVAGLSSNAKVSNLSDENRHYLAHHRANILQSQ